MGDYIKLALAGLGLAYVGGYAAGYAATAGELGIGLRVAMVAMSVLVAGLGLVIIFLAPF